MMKSILSSFFRWNPPCFHRWNPLCFHRWNPPFLLVKPQDMVAAVTNGPAAGIATTSAAWWTISPGKPCWFPWDFLVFGRKNLEKWNKQWLNWCWSIWTWDVSMQNDCLELFWSVKMMLYAPEMAKHVVWTIKTRLLPMKGRWVKLQNGDRRSKLGDCAIKNNVVASQKIF